MFRVDLPETVERSPLRGLLFEEVLVFFDERRFGSFLVGFGDAARGEPQERAKIDGFPKQIHRGENFSQSHLLIKMSKGNNSSARIKKLLVKSTRTLTPPAG